MSIFDNELFQQIRNQTPGNGYPSRRPIRSSYGGYYGNYNPQAAQNQQNDFASGEAQRNREFQAFMQRQTQEAARSAQQGQNQLTRDLANQSQRNQREMYNQQAEDAYRNSLVQAQKGPQEIDVLMRQYRESHPRQNQQSSDSTGWPQPAGNVPPRASGAGQPNPDMVHVQNVGWMSKADAAMLNRALQADAHPEGTKPSSSVTVDGVTYDPFAPGGQQTSQAIGQATQKALHEQMANEAIAEAKRKAQNNADLYNQGQWERRHPGGSYDRWSQTQDTPDRQEGERQVGQFADWATANDISTKVATDTIDNIRTAHADPSHYNDVAPKSVDEEAIRARYGAPPRIIGQNYYQAAQNNLAQPTAAAPNAPSAPPQQAAQVPPRASTGRGAAYAPAQGGSIPFMFNGTEAWLPTANQADESPKPSAPQAASNVQGQVPPPGFQQDTPTTQPASVGQRTPSRSNYQIALDKIYGPKDAAATPVSGDANKPMSLQDALEADMRDKLEREARVTGDRSKVDKYDAMKKGQTTESSSAAAITSAISNRVASNTAFGSLESTYVDDAVGDPNAKPGSAERTRADIMLPRLIAERNTLVAQGGLTPQQAIEKIAQDAYAAVMNDPNMKQLSPNGVHPIIPFTVRNQVFATGFGSPASVAGKVADRVRLMLSQPTQPTAAPVQAK